MRTPRIILVAGTLALSVCISSIVAGQKVGGAGGTVKDPGSGGGKAPTRRTTAPVKTVFRTRVERVTVTPTTGSLSVAAESNATVLVEPLNVRRGQALQGVVPNGERIFVFNDLNPGRYRVAAILSEHHPVEEEVTIAANKSQSVTLDFRPILHSIIIKTNVTSGDLKYALEGQPLSNVVPIQNKTAQLELPAGKYVVEITANEFGYETLRHGFLLTDDQTVLDLPLKRIVLTTETLSPAWTSAELQAWEMPVGWLADSRKHLLVKGPGVALPREARNRYYKDFRLESNVKMVNGVATSFALRARDSRNYYLLQLTGKNSDEPYVVRLLAVKDGVPQRLRAIPISKSSAGAMASGDFFNVSIKMIDYEITVDIVDSQTGAPYTLGVLTDPDHNFAVGAVGIAGDATAENVIERFVVCTDKCLDE
jgi:hypothetical protein